MRITNDSDSHLIKLLLTVVIVSHDPTIALHVDRVVSIRDGKTSTETVRVGQRTISTEEVYSEYVVVDSAGRLQIPEDLRGEYHVAGRVFLERHPDGILIRPEK